MTNKEILLAAAKVFETKDHCTGRYWEDKDGNSLGHPRDVEVAKCCILGAIYYVQPSMWKYGDFGVFITNIRNAIQKATGYTVITFNDFIAKDKKMVIDALNKAAELVEE